HKGFSERLVSAPVSPLGQRLYVGTKDATSVALASTMTIDPTRQALPANEEQPVHPLYDYAYVTDREEGLVVVGPLHRLLENHPLGGAARVRRRRGAEGRSDRRSGRPARRRLDAARPRGGRLRRAAAAAAARAPGRAAARAAGRGRPAPLRVRARRGGAQGRR